MLTRLGLMLGLAAALAAPTPGAAQPAGDSASAKKAIAKTLTEVADAYNSGDAAELAKRWSDSGVYISQQTGEEVKGREKIEKEFAGQFAKNKGAQLKMTVGSIRLITPEVATVDGGATVKRPGELPFESTFTMVLVKKNGHWLIDNVRETELPASANSFERLQPLSWMVGEWQRKEKDVEIRISCDWFANKNFLAKHFSVLENGDVKHQGLQIIGWDAGQKRLRSWVFESDGTFGEGVWKNEGKQWAVRVVGMLPSGKKSVATQIMTPVDESSYKWKVIGRSVGDQVLPNVAEVTLTRKTDAATKEGE